MRLFRAELGGRRDPLRVASERREGGDAQLFVDGAGIEHERVQQAVSDALDRFASRSASIGSGSPLLRPPVVEQGGKVPLDRHGPRGRTSPAREDGA